MSLIENEDFTPNNYHHNEYLRQRDHVEQTLGAEWALGYKEWCLVFFDRGYLRSIPPVTTNRYLTRKSRSRPFQIDNIQISKNPESNCKGYILYRYVKGKWVTSKY